VKPKKGNKKGGKVLSLPDSADGGSSSVSSSSSSTGDMSQVLTTASQSVAAAIAAAEKEKEKDKVKPREVLPLLTNKLTGINSKLSPVRPHRWRVVNEGGEWKNGKLQHFIDVKIKPDMDWNRLCIVAVSMIPIHLVDIYNKKFEIRNSRFIVRVLVPTNLDEAKTGVTLESVKTSWHNPTFRYNFNVRETHTSVMILAGDNFEGLVGFDDSEKVFHLSRVVKEITSGDHDAVMRLFIQSCHLGYSDKAIPNSISPSNLREYFCVKVQDILIDHLVDPTYEAYCRTLAGRIEGYDLIEDYQNRWSRCECPNTHAKRWNLSEGDLMVRELEFDEFNVDDEANMAEVVQDLHKTMEHARYPPNIADLTQEEKQRRCEIQISGALIDSFARAVFRITKFEKFQNHLRQKIQNDHEQLVLGLEESNDGSAAQDLTLLPSSSRGLSPLKKGNRGFGITRGQSTHFEPFLKSAGGASYATVPTELNTNSPPRIGDAVSKGTWLVGGNGHTDSVFGGSATAHHSKALSKMGKHPFPPPTSGRKTKRGGQVADTIMASPTESVGPVLSASAFQTLLASDNQMVVTKNPTPINPIEEKGEEEEDAMATD